MDFIPVPEMQNISPEHCQLKNNRMFFTFFEEMKNIENRFAWFLAELCKAEKDVPNDKQNQRQTECYGVFSALCTSL